MSEFALTEIRKGLCVNYVSLMRLSREITPMDGVIDAALMMSSPSNITNKQAAGLINDDHGACNNDWFLPSRRHQKRLHGPHYCRDLGGRSIAPDPQQLGRRAVSPDLWLLRCTYIPKPISVLLFLKFSKSADIRPKRNHNASHELKALHAAKQ